MGAGLRCSVPAPALERGLCVRAPLGLPSSPWQPSPLALGTKRAFPVSVLPVFGTPQHPTGRRLDIVSFEGAGMAAAGGEEGA